MTLIGCGWLGRPLATLLLKKDFEVKATTRGSDVPDGVCHQHLDLEHFHTLPENFLRTEDILIYSIPPLSLPMIKSFFSQVHPEQKIIFISSTSVYGKNAGAVDENVVLDLTTGNQQLIATEAYLHSRFKNLTIIRPGGLYDAKRHPVFFLQGRKALTSGSEFTHLVHQQDCINGILSVIDLNCWGEKFNFVSDLQMLKKDYYLKIAVILSLTPPEYSDVQSENPTRIANRYSKEKLNISYLDPLNFII